MKEYDYPVHQPLKEIMMRFFLQLLPTAMVVFYILWNAEYHVVFLQDKSTELCLACGTGMLVSLITYQSRLRFVPSFLLLLLTGTGISIFIRHLGSGDIESFFMAHRFRLYFFLFCVGWVISFGLMRIRFFPTLIALLLVGTSIWISGSTQQMMQKDEYWVFFIFFDSCIAVWCLYYFYLGAAQGLPAVWRERGTQNAAECCFLYLPGFTGVKHSTAPV
ncbi:MAG: hypothetical protein KL787_03350 [Taibaiella sp.]|nr:hypothetical protein [Taibaiella sp.]